MKNNNSTNTILWLFKKLKGLRFMMLFLISLGILQSLVSVIFIYTSKGIVDAAVDHDSQTLQFQTLILLVLILAQLVFKVLIPNLEEFIRSKVEISLRRQLADALLDKPYAEVTALHSGEWMTYFFSDIDTITEGLVVSLSTLFKKSAELVFALALLYALEPTFLFAAILGGLVIFFFSTFIRRYVKKLFKELQERKGKVQSHLQEIVEHFVVAKVFNARPQLLDKLDQRQKDYLSIRNRRRRIFTYANAGINTVYQTAYFIAILWGANGIYSGQISYGALTAMLQLVSQIMSPVQAMSGVTSRFMSMMASSERLMEIEANQLDYGKKKIIPLRGEFKALVFDNVSFAYEQDEVFKQASFRLSLNEIVGLLGQSGIGKTTLFHVLLGLYPITSGDIKVIFEEKGEEVAYSIHDYRLNDLIAYVPQGNTLFSGSLRENLSLAKEGATDEEIWQALDLACASDFVNELPNALDTVLIERGKNLSEGQRQRLALARAFLSERPIILYDEMTSALDERVEQILLQNIKSMNQKIAIIISHKQTTRQICTRQFILENQRLKEGSYVYDQL